MKMSKVEGVIAVEMSLHAVEAGRKFTAATIAETFQVLRCEAPGLVSVVREEQEDMGGRATKKDRINRLASVLEKAGIIAVAPGREHKKRVKYVFASRVTDLI